VVESSLLEQVLSLPADDRRELVDEVAMSLENEESSLSPRMRALANARLADAKADPFDGDSWEVVRARVWDGRR
jgi:putative addiction module component (TIGR02574 family)